MGQAEEAVGAMAAGGGRSAYARFMRKELCLAEMVEPDGSFRDEYFEPKRDLSDGVEWSPQAVSKLEEGLALFGVGAWSEIRQALLVHWDELAIKLKTCALLGAQDLTPYLGRKLTPEEMEEARRANVAQATAAGTLRAGVLPTSLDSLASAE